MASGRIPKLNFLVSSLTKFFLVMAFMPLLAIRVASAADKLPRPYCAPREPHVQLFANPPVSSANLFAWRKADPSVEVLLSHTGMTAQCYAVTKSQVEKSDKLKWEDGLCFRLSSPDGSVYVEGCN